MSRECRVALSHDATGLSAVCECGIPDHTHLVLLLHRFPWFVIEHVVLA